MNYHAGDPRGVSGKFPTLGDSREILGEVPRTFWANSGKYSGSRDFPGTPKNQFALFVRGMSRVGMSQGFP